MKIETPWYRWTLTVAEAQVMSDACDMGEDAFPRSSDARREVVAVRTTLRQFTRKPSSEGGTVVVNLSHEVAACIVSHCALMADWVASGDCEPDALTDAQHDALVGIVARCAAHFGLVG